MNILIIAPFFAPNSEVGSVRMMSLSKYLIKNGHSVTVLCWSVEKLLTMYSAEELNSKVPDGVKIVEFNSVAGKIPILDDIRFGYELRRKIGKLIEPRAYDVALVTCGPYFSLKAIPKLRKKYNIPCILDFRDLGALNYRPMLRDDYKKIALCKRPIDKLYKTVVYLRENDAVKIADGVICVSDIDLEKMRIEYNIPVEKLIVATNGFDEEKLAKIKAKEKKSGIVGAVFGKFMYYSKARAEALLLSIDKLRKDGVDIKLMHIGRKNDAVFEAIKKNNIEIDCFQACGLKEYGEGMSLLGSADFFVVEDTSPDDVGTKIYDYIFWNKPIIASVPKEIPLAQLVDSFEHGYVCDNQEKIDIALNDIILNKYANLDSKVDRMKYSRVYQNKKIENLMKRLVLRR